MTNPADSSLHPSWNFSYFYDSFHHNELYIHSPGHGDEVCSMLSNSSQECHVLNTNGDLYVWTSNLSCSNKNANFMIRSDWLEAANAVYEKEGYIAETVRMYKFIS